MSRQNCFCLDGVVSGPNIISGPDRLIPIVYRSLINYTPELVDDELVIDNKASVELDEFELGDDALESELLESDDGEDTLD